MKKIILSLLALAASLPLVAQQADGRIGELINTEDWFGLIEEYPRLKDSLRHPMLKPVAEAMIARYTNRRAEAVGHIEELLTKHQAELGANLMSFVRLRLQLLQDMGQYAKAATSLRSTLDQLEARGAGRGAEGLEELERYWKTLEAMAPYPALAISRPNHDSRVRLTLRQWKPIRWEAWMEAHRDTTGKNRQLGIMLPVGLHGEQVPFTFDTGATKTFVTEGFARKHGLKLLGDSIRANNTTARYTFIDSLQIGDITVRNLMAVVGLEGNENALALVGIDAVLGADVMEAIGETQICMEDSTLRFPLHSAPRPAPGINLLSNSMTKAQADGEALTFFFDTGNASSNAFYLFAPYYHLHQAEVDAIATTDTIAGGGYGTAKAQAMKVIPNFSLTVAGHPVRVAEAFIDMEENGAYNHGYGKQCAGNIGIAAVLQSRTVTLNYRDMFLKLE